MADMISVATGFQSSVNIAYDINDEAKLKNYIPTKSALKLLEDILLSTGKESTDRARILIGAYGKGKSCLLYTSDAADDMQCVDLGGRRIIKKK